MHPSIPWVEMVKAFKIKDHLKGPNSMFSPRGKVALMFFDNYSGCSDKKLIKQLNGNIFYQIFLI